MVIPKRIRDRKRLHIGDRVSIEDHERTVHVDTHAGWAQATAGCLAASVAQMEPEMMDELAERVAIQEAREEFEGFE